MCAFQEFQSIVNWYQSEGHVILDFIAKDHNTWLLYQSFTLTQKNRKNHINQIISQGRGKDINPEKWKTLKFFSIFSVLGFCWAASTGAVWRSDLEKNKTEKILWSKNRRRVRCSAILVCERFFGHAVTRQRPAGGSICFKGGANCLKGWNTPERY